tara:strand:- start:13 stop:891 length:879 start_codon:yes stop_codon:yes gene_type:complete
MKQFRNLLYFIYTCFIIIFIDNRNKYRIIFQNIIFLILGKIFENKILINRKENDFKKVKDKLFIKNKYMHLISFSTSLIHLSRLIFYLLNKNFNKGYTSFYTNNKNHHGKHFIPVCIFIFIYTCQKSNYFNFYHKIIGRCLSVLYLIIVLTGALRTNSMISLKFSNLLLNFGFIAIYTFFGSIDAAIKKDFISHIINMDTYDNFIMSFSELFPIFSIISYGSKFKNMKLDYEKSIKPFKLLALYTLIKILITIFRIKSIDKYIVIQYIFINLYITFIHLFESYSEDLKVYLF